MEFYLYMYIHRYMNVCFIQYLRINESTSFIIYLFLKKSLFPAQSWLSKAINHMSETCQVSAKAQVGSESDEDRTEVFYSLSWAWQVVIKGSIKSYLLIVWPHIFYCNSFIWPCLSSFKWAASLWVPSMIDIFPANDVSPWSQRYFHTGWSSPTEGPQSVSVLQMVLDRMLVFSPPLSGQTSPALLELLSLHSQERFAFSNDFIKII